MLQFVVSPLAMEIETELGPIEHLLTMQLSQRYDLWTLGSCRSGCGLVAMGT